MGRSIPDPDDLPVLFFVEANVAAPDIMEVMKISCNPQGVESSIKKENLWKLNALV
jgi:hypothetical protein